MQIIAPITSYISQGFVLFIVPNVSVNSDKERVMKLRFLKCSGQSFIWFFMFISLFSLLPSINVLAKSAVPKTKNIGCFNSIINKDTIYVVDNQLSTDQLKSINPSCIVDIAILANAPSNDKHISDSNKVTMLVTTKAYAINQYQKKFKAFSEKYKAYLQIHQNKDDSCTYVLNGIIFNDINRRIKNLYEIPDKKIKGVKIVENPWYNGGESKKMLVLITTKQ